MNWWKRTPKGLVLFAGIMAGVALSPSLSGCSVFEQVIDALGVGGYALEEDGAIELVRFQDIYEKLAKPAGDKNDDFKHFSDAFKRVRLSYVHQIEDAKLIDTAITGVKELKVEPGSGNGGEIVEAALDKMLASLDPHSTYLNPQELREVTVSTKGEFGGLGIQVTMENGFVKVVSPIEGTPAYRAGIKTGDLITHLDGKSIEGVTLMEAVRRMRGRPRTDIRLTINREGHAPFKVTITRAIIKIKPVRWRVEGDIGYLRVTHFSEKMEDAVYDAMDALSAKLEGRMKGLVLDLRNNPGGLFSQSMALSDAFLDDGTIVSVKGRVESNNRSYDAEEGDLAQSLPMVVLINGGSASASEIVASALQDHGRAVVMGGRSFGKGSVQTIMPLPRKGAVKLTTSLYYAPSGRTIQAQGVEPDIVLLPEKEAKRQREADLPGFIPAVSGKDKTQQATLKETDCPETGEAKDRYLGCALELLGAGSKAKFLALHGRETAM